jgi:hypothetical protein
MKLKVKLMMFTAAVAFSATMAQATITVNDVVQTYQDAAYTSIEVKEGPTQIKVEAIKDGMKIEVVYDKASGDVIRQESHSASAEDAAQTGVEVSSTDRDFSDDTGVSDDDGANHDAGDDHGSDANDDGSDDQGGSSADDNSGSDDQGDDDNSGSGSDHGGGDDNGGDDN